MSLLCLIKPSISKQVFALDAHANSLAEFTASQQRQFVLFGWTYVFHYDLIGVRLAAAIGENRHHALAIG